MFYAITGLGWGKGETPEEAIKVYRGIQKKNFPHLSDEELDEAWGFVWDVPDDTSGFYDDGVALTFRHGSDGSERLQGTADMKVANVGDVPEQFRV